MLVISIMICLIWFSKAISFIGYMAKKGINLSEFFDLFILVLPWLLLFIIPLALFISVIMVYNRLVSNSELIILKNAGLNKLQLSRSTMAFAALCSLICYLLTFYLIPLANKKFRLAKTDFQHNYANILISPGIFETINNLTIYVADRDSSNKVSGILVYDNRHPKYSLAITAKSGNIIKDQDLILLYLTEGAIQKFNFAARKAEVLRFNSYVINLTDTGQKETKFRWKPKERYINELLNPEEGISEEERSRYKLEFHKRIVYPAFPTVLALIALVFVLRAPFNRRGNILSNVAAALTGFCFVLSITFLYDFIETHHNLLPLLYLDLFFFTAVNAFFLYSD